MSAEIQKLYIAYFNRPADPGGLAYWTDQLARGATMTTIANSFSASAEYQAIYAGKSNLVLIDQLYQNLFGRTADVGGLLFWSNEMLAGRVTITTVASALSSGTTPGSADNIAINSKIAAASAFTAAIDTAPELLAYSGSAATAQASAWLSTVTTAATLATAIAPATLAAAVASSVASGTGSAGSTFTLTVDTDNLVGNSANNTFNASGFFNAPTGTTLQTLSSNDSIDGGQGTDTLNVLLNGAGATTRPVALTSIEVINLTNTAAANILDLGGATNVTTLNSVNSATNIAQFNNVQSAPTAFGLTNTAVGLTANILNTALEGTTDQATLTLNGVTAGAVILQTITAASGYETLNIVSSGSTANVLTSVSGGNGNSLARINVSGTQGVNLGTTLDATVLTVNASTATQAVTVTQTNATAFTYTGGSGADTIILGATYGTTDTINGGGGTADVLSITTAIAQAIAAAQTNVTNIEQLTISDAQAGAINTTFFAGVTRINLALAAGSNTVITIDSGDDVRFQTTTTATPDLLVTGIGTTDTATVTLSSAVGLAADALTTTGIETLTINSLGLTGTTNTIFQLVMTNTAATEAAVLTGAANLTFTNTTADNVNASALTGALVQSNATVAAGGGGVTITGGTGADTIRGSTGADILSGGAGNDNIRSEGGIDVIDMGAGDDTLNFLALDAGAGLIASANRVNVSNFTATNTAPTTGSGIDVISVNAGAGAALTGFTLGAGAATAAQFNTVTAAGNVTNTAAQAYVELAFEFSAGVNLNAGGANELNGTTLLSALGALTGTTAGTITLGGTTTDAFIIAYQGGRAFLYGTDNGTAAAATAAEIGLLGVFEGVAVGGFAPGNFFGV